MLVAYARSSSRSRTQYQLYTVQFWVSLSEKNPNLLIIPSLSPIADGKLGNTHEKEMKKGRKQVNVKEGKKKREKRKRKTQPIIVPWTRENIKMVGPWHCLRI